MTQHIQPNGVGYRVRLIVKWAAVAQTAGRELISRLETIIAHSAMIMWLGLTRMATGTSAKERRYNSARFGGPH